MFKDILIPLSCWPNPTPKPALQSAINLAVQLDAHVTGLVMEPSLALPVAFRTASFAQESSISGRQAELHDLAKAEQNSFEQDARRTGLPYSTRIASLTAGNWSPVVDFARLRDLTVLPGLVGDDAYNELMQALVFESGRPVLLLPASNEASFKIERIVIGWDFSRAAARAVGDAMPFLQRAAEVRVVTVGDDKQLPQNTSGPEFTAHLARNGVNAELVEIDRAGRSVGAILEDQSAHADMLVMGAFGHSRLRDFLLGGATRHMLKGPGITTFLSH